MSDHLFNTQVETRNGVTHMAMAGELDLGTAPILHDLLSSAEADGVHSILLDMRDLKFIDSTGLRSVLGGWTRAHDNGHRLVLVGANRSIRRLCRITDTEFLLDAAEGTQVLEEFTGASTVLDRIALDD